MIWIGLGLCGLGLFVALLGIFDKNGRAVERGVLEIVIGCLFLLVGVVV